MSLIAVINQYNQLSISIVCILLFILLILFVINFINHFNFNYKCPLIIRDLEVAGIYPTLILIYITITSIISCIVISTSQSTLFIPYSSCYTTFNVYTNSLFDFTFMANDFTQILITFFLSTVCILETYFSFSRYFNVCDITHKYHLNIPFTVYCAICLLLSWLSMTIIPILTVFLSIFHILNVSYFSYYFHRTIRDSYAHILSDTDFQQFGRSDTYSALQQQVNQIYKMSILSATSSVITAYCYSSYVLCGYSSIISILLTINSLLFFAQFTKNRVFAKYIFKCKCRSISHLCAMPCSTIIQRRAKRKWIRDRQKSIFDRLQQTLQKKWSKAALDVDGAVPDAPAGSVVHAHSLNNSVDRSNMGLPCHDMSLEILDMDIDPDNEILNIEMLHTMDLNNPFERDLEVEQEQHLHSLSEKSSNGDFKPVISSSTSKVHTAQNSTLSLNHADSTSVRSDISDVFTKMRSIGQTLRGRARPSNLDLVKELATQIDHDENMNFREEFKEKAKQKAIKDLKEDANILKMKQKTNKQISFGADIALEIIKDSILSRQENEKQNETLTKPILPLINFNSEPRLMSSYIDIYGEDTANIQGTGSQTQFKVIDMQSNGDMPSDANLIQKQRSRTAPNSPETQKVRVKLAKKLPNLLTAQSDPVSVSHNMNRHSMEIKLDDELAEKLKQRKRVFLYDMSTTQPRKEMNMSSLEDLTHTQSLIQIPKEFNDKNHEKPALNLATINTENDLDADDGSYVVYDDYFYHENGSDAKDDIQAPLTPNTRSPNSNFDNVNLTPVDEENMNTTANYLRTQYSEQSKTKSIMGTLRDIFTVHIEDENGNTDLSMHSNTKSITNTSKLAKINAFLKHNGMTQHHQNVNEIFRNMRFTKHNELQSHSIASNVKDVENNQNIHKKANTLIMETIAEH